MFLRCKIAKYFKTEIPSSIYFAFFDLHLSYCSLFWAQNLRTIYLLTCNFKEENSKNY